MRTRADIFPRVVQRAPRPGDGFALDKRNIAAMFRFIQSQYLYGVKRIELLARKSEEVGNPYGSYLSDEAVVRLYSTPTDLWIFKTMPATSLHCKVLAGFGATVEPVGEGSHVRWLNRKDLARFLFVRVLAHELGHHHDFQYKHKRPLKETARAMEQSAETHIWHMRASSVFYTAELRGLLSYGGQ